MYFFKNSSGVTRIRFVLSGFILSAIKKVLSIHLCFMLYFRLHWSNSRYRDIMRRFVGMIGWSFVAIDLIIDSNSFKKKYCCQSFLQNLPQRCWIFAKPAPLAGQEEQKCLRNGLGNARRCITQRYEMCEASRARRWSIFSPWWRGARKRKPPRRRHWYRSLRKRAVPNGGPQTSPKRRRVKRKSKK